MKAILLILALGLVVVFAYSTTTPSPTPEPKQSAVPWDQRGSPITPGGPIIREWVVSGIGAGLYNHNFILEFEPGGRPFETTKASRDTNRKNRVRILNALKVAASRQDKQIAADINLAQVAWDAGGTQDREAAANKLAADLLKIKVTGKEAISYDAASPWGQIIANVENRLAYDDKSEAEAKAKADALRDAKRAAGAN